MLANIEDVLVAGLIFGGALVLGLALMGLGLLQSLVRAHKDVAKALFLVSEKLGVQETSGE